MLILKLLLLFSLGCIIWQDIKERRVYWYLFPLTGILCAVLHYKNTLPELFLVAAVMNIIFVLVLVAVIWVYARFKMKSKTADVIGLGDVLLFIGLAFSFSGVSFMVIFTSALIFSLIVHLVLKKSKPETVPLAGYICAFFAVTYIAYWMGFVDSVYTI